jgi:hypothetical protein
MSNPTEPAVKTSSELSGEGSRVGCTAEERSL